ALEFRNGKLRRVEGFGMQLLHLVVRDDVIQATASRRFLQRFGSDIVREQSNDARFLGGFFRRAISAIERPTPPGALCFSFLPPMRAPKFLFMPTHADSFG